MFEPVHGSAPDIAGKGHREPARDLPLGGDDAPPRARPREDAEAVEAAVDAALGDGLRTPDLAWDERHRPPMSDLPEQVEVGTEEMTAAVLGELGG